MKCKRCYDLAYLIPPASKVWLGDMVRHLSLESVNLLWMELVTGLPSCSVMFFSCLWFLVIALCKWRTVSLRLFLSLSEVRSTFSFLKPCFLIVLETSSSISLFWDSSRLKSLLPIKFSPPACFLYIDYVFLMRLPLNGKWFFLLNDNLSSWTNKKSCPIRELKGQLLYIIKRFSSSFLWGMPASMNSSETTSYPNLNKKGWHVTLGIKLQLRYFLLDGVFLNSIHDHGTRHHSYGARR